MKCNRQNLLVILGHFLPFYPLNSLKNENIKKMKKMPGDVTYEIVIFHFELLFDLLHIPLIPTPLTAPKMKISKKRKKVPGNISSFYTSVPKIMIMCAMLFLRYDT